MNKLECMRPRGHYLPYVTEVYPSYLYVMEYQELVFLCFVKAVMIQRLHYQDRTLALRKHHVDSVY